MLATISLLTLSAVSPPEQLVRKQADSSSTPPTPPGVPIFNANDNRGEGYGVEPIDMTDVKGNDPSNHGKFAELAECECTDSSNATAIMIRMVSVLLIWIF
jgi:hypothetical protein